MPRISAHSGRSRQESEVQALLVSGENGSASASSSRARESTAVTTLVVWGTAAANPVLTALAGLLVARSLRPASYGEVAYFFSVFGLVLTVGSMGLTTRVTLAVAQLRGQGDDSRARSVTHTLLTLRLTTVAALLGLSIVAAVSGNAILAAAGIAGSVALVTGFLLGIVQGLGKPRVAAGIQALQVLLYLGGIVAWASVAAERVFVAVIASWTLPLLAALPSCRDALGGWTWAISFDPRRWQEALLASGQVYAVTLLLAPYGAIAVLALGSARRFEDAALVSVTLTLALALSAVEATVLMVHYEPRLCHLLARSKEAAFEWFDGFYHVFAALSVAASVILAMYPGALITLLFTERYAAASSVLAGLAAGAGFLALGQFMLWTLFVHGRVRWALASALVQLTSLSGWVGVVILSPSLPLYWLGIGHTLSAAAGLAVCMLGMKQLHPWHGWHFKRLVGAVVAALGTAVLLERVLPTGGTRGETAGLLLLVGVLVCAASAIFLAPQTLRQPIDR